MSGSEGHALFAVRVQRRTQLADDIIGLELTSLDGLPLPAYSAGAHIDVELPNGLVRQYSLCGQGAGRYEIGIRRAGAVQPAPIATSVRAARSVSARRATCSPWCRQGTRCCSQAASA